MKKEVNSKKDGGVKSVIGKIEQNQAAESNKGTPAAQADIGVEKIHQKLPSNLTRFQRETKDLK